MKTKMKASQDKKCFFLFFFSQNTLISVSVCQIVSLVVPDLIWRQTL